MAYNTKKMLEDVNGDLIPQYYDPVADEFKPLTNDPKDVRLNGSIVELNEIRNLTVTPGSFIYLLDRRKRVGFKSIRVNLRLADKPNIRIIFSHRQGNNEGSSGMTTIETSEEDRFSGEFILYGSYYDVTAHNVRAEDIVINYAEVIGVV